MLPSTEKTMTVKEVAELLGVHRDTVLSWGNKLFPEKFARGVTTLLNEEEVTRIKQAMSKNYSFRNVPEVRTDLEYTEMAKEVMEYLVHKTNTLKAEVALLTTRNHVLENRVNMLVHDSKTYTATEIAKECGMQSAKALNEFLEFNDVQYKVNGTWVLHAKYSGCGYESIKQEELDNGKIIYNRHWTGKGREFLIEFVKNHHMH
jgi:phage antirepressor YoqD-like protein